MKITKNKKFELILVSGILILLFVFPVVFAGSYSRSTPQFSPPSGSASYLARQGIALTPSWDESKCEVGQDFVLQINPSGCSPSVVTSDLLEEQNVPVFCPITATKINPLIDVNAIKNLRFKFNGTKPDEVTGVGYHPARAALRTGDTLLNSPILENVGYVVINLKKQKNESSMPEWVQGNLSVEIQYDIKNAFGIGKGTFYLPELDENEWGENHHLYGFWQNRFFLRAEDIATSGANIAIYTSKDLRHSGVKLGTGQTSNMIYLPGQYCKAGVQLKLESLDNPGTRVRFFVDDDVVEVIKGEKFLDNRCKVTGISNEKVEVYCSGSGSESGQDISFSRLGTDEYKEGDVAQYYQQAIENYEKVVNQYGDVKVLDVLEGDYPSYGAQALKEASVLAQKGNKQSDVEKFNEMLKERYGVEGNTIKVKSSRSIRINGVYRTISLVDVVNSGIKDYGVRISVGSESAELGKDDSRGLGGIYVKLISLTERDAKVGISTDGKSYSTYSIIEGESREFGKKTIRLNEIYLSKVAKVSVIPNINYAKTNSQVHFKIGIEKRAIQLSPEKIKEKIENLNNTIEKWQNRADSLGTVVKGMKGACLATGAALTVKNFFSNMGGGSIARQNTMSGLDGKSGMRKICRDEIGKGTFASYEECFANSGIEKRIERNQEIDKAIIKAQNVELVKIRKMSLAGSTWFGKDQVDEVKYKNNLIKSMNEEFFKNVEEDEKISTKTSASKNELIDLRYYLMAKRDYSGDIVSFDADRMKSLLDKAQSASSATTDSGDKIEFGNHIGLVATYDKDGKPIAIPLPEKDLSSLGEEAKGGWYIKLKYELTGSTYESGIPKTFYICNIGKGGSMDSQFGSCSGCGRMFSKGDSIDSIGKICNLGVAKSKILYRVAKEAYDDAADNYKKGAKTVDILGTKMQVALGPLIPQTTCQDFMDPDDCKILFNVCDPVVCPSSRCNFGGKYYLTDVIQSGLIGSTFACLSNFGNPLEGGVAIPVCLSGIHAGMEGLLSVFKAHRDCLQHKLETGQNIGFCDEIYSIQLCDFFWKQVAPFVDIIIPTMLEFVTGQFVQGGGEYRGVQTAWTNAEKSMNYFTQYYAVNAYKMFKAKSITEVGSEMCRNYLSASYPDGKSFLDALTEPVSPPQFHAWLDYSLYSGVTVPPTNKYSVFYHIYGGTEKDEMEYLVYLKGSGAMSGRTVKIAQGKIKSGGYKTEKKDFTEAAGFTELCVVVGGKEECGFGRVTTSFALDSVNDYYVEQQNKTENINSAEDCISGTSSLYSFVNPNVQAGAEDFINHDLRGAGIVRVCSTTNPGANTDKDRWKAVGNCGDENMICWLDAQSVTKATSRTKVTEDGIVSAADKISNAIDKEYMKTEEANSELILIKNTIENENYLKKMIELLEAIEKGEKYNGVVKKKMLYDYHKAGLLLLKARAYNYLAQMEKGEQDAETGAIKKEEVLKDEVGEVGEKKCEYFKIPFTDTCIGGEKGIKSVELKQQRDKVLVIIEQSGCDKVIGQFITTSTNYEDYSDKPTPLPNSLKYESFGPLKSEFELEFFKSDGFVEGKTYKFRARCLGADGIEINSKISVGGITIEESDEGIKLNFDFGLGIVKNSEQLVVYYIFYNGREYYSFTKKGIYKPNEEVMSFKQFIDFKESSHNSLIENENSDIMYSITIYFKGVECKKIEADEKINSGELYELVMFCQKATPPEQ